VTAAERSRLDSLAAEQVELGINLERLAASLERHTKALEAMAGLVARALDLDPEGQPERTAHHERLVPRSPGGRARPRGGA
jgi:hypothetical protein